MNDHTAMPIDYADFEKVDIRVGRIVDVQDFPEARKPAFKLWVDFGPGLGIKKTSAQVTVNYTHDALKGKLVAAVVNFPPRQIGKYMSEILVLGFPDAQGNVTLFSPDKDIPLGGKLY
ncbi:MAG: tRNA-binding protein [Micavibrio aeruginosavorus]|uniref:tRNA-binding protein n=1 Tax=Micavibrio aeruginosavorus TaxID=349221 RepID=A0A2W5N4Q0_9BACT|nr:MAG: tRNA-binding protein [Micavibrio aeruginosavorus]